MLSAPQYVHVYVDDTQIMYLLIYYYRKEITEMPVTMIISGKISTLNVPAENENDTIKIMFHLKNVKMHTCMICAYYLIYIIKM